MTRDSDLSGENKKKPAEGIDRVTGDGCFCETI